MSKTAGSEYITGRDMAVFGIQHPSHGRYEAAHIQIS